MIGHIHSFLVASPTIRFAVVSFATVAPSIAVIKIQISIINKHYTYSILCNNNYDVSIDSSFFTEYATTADTAAVYNLSIKSYLYYSWQSMKSRG